MTRFMNWLLLRFSGKRRIPPASLALAIWLKMIGRKAFRWNPLETRGRAMEDGCAGLVYII